MTEAISLYFKKNLDQEEVLLTVFLSWWNYVVWIFNISEFFVMWSSTTTVTQSYLDISVLILYYSRCSFFIPSFPASYCSFHIFTSEHDCTPLHFYKCFTQWIQQLILVCQCIAYTAVALHFHTKCFKEDQHKKVFNRLCKTAEHKKFYGTEHSTCIFRSLLQQFQFTLF